MTPTTPPTDLLDSLVRALEPLFRLDDLVALSPERALYRAWDRLLKRPVALLVHRTPDGPGRGWFLRENETLAALDPPAIRHVYAAGTAGGFAYRTANWVDGESLADALRRGPRPIPTAHALVRDLLGGLEHAHARGIIMRRLVPTTLMLDMSGRAVITDLRYANSCLGDVPPADAASRAPFCAPEERAAAPQVGESGFERRLRRALGDDYELLEDIGAGGFGRVYRARDLGLERDVAIKVLHPSLTADLGVVERFRREAQLAARLRHPNIVSIYDIGGRAGLQWYTMELIPGASLGQIIAAHGPLPVDRVVRLLDQALSALEQAHAFGLVHRDLKPENMLLEPDGRLRITDFGLALALRGDGRYGGATSRSGTPQFASPEQLLGEKGTPRTDLYSLSAVGYFALLGRPPFEGPTTEAIPAKQTTDALPDLHAERPAVERELALVLRRAVSSRPEERFSTATAFRQALHDATGGVWRRVWKVLRPD